MLNRLTRAILIAFGLTGIVWLAVNFGALAGPVNAWNNENIRREWVQASGRWANAQIVNYDIDVDGQWGPGCLDLSSTLRVREGKITDVILKGTDLMPFTIALDKQTLCYAERFTVTRILEHASFVLSSTDPSRVRLQISFDSNFGYVSVFRHECFNTNLGDCSYWLEFSNFKDLSSP
ncbi:MAG: hypothetical protein JNL09_05825 [Anaerolineales bacterium]|nr:hypothetical protein [Anaerolineales bacterium]